MVNFETDSSGNFTIDFGEGAATITYDSTTGLWSMSGGVSSIADGDGTERTVWVIASGASDPAGAGANDIILEQQ